VSRVTFRWWRYCNRDEDSEEIRLGDRSQHSQLVSADGTATSYPQAQLYEAGLSDVEVGGVVQGE
jgi:hypothetical protein